MDLRIATLEQITKELKKRPIKFLFAYVEQTPNPSCDVTTGGMDFLQAIQFGECALDYLCACEDEFDEEDHI